MSNLNALELVAIHMNYSTLRNFSKTLLWNVISHLFSNQHFWYLRAQTCVNFQLEWNSSENWHQVYNILDNANRVNPFCPKQALSYRVNGYNLYAVKLLLKLGRYDPSVINCATLFSAVALGSIEVTLILLSDPRVRPPLDTFREAVRIAVKLQHLEVMRILSTYPGVKDLTARYIEQELCIAVKENNLQALRLLIEEADMTCYLASSLLSTACQDSSLDMIKLFLSMKNIDVNFVGHVSSLEVAIIGSRLEVVALLLNDTRTILTERIMGLATQYKHSGITHLIFTDHRADEKIVTNHVKLHSHNLKLEGRTIEALIRHERFTFQNMRSEVMEYILVSIREYIAGSLDECVRMSEGLFSRDSLLQMFSKSGRWEYSSSHYYMLLRELILKRLGINYYFKWLSLRSSTGLIHRALTSTNGQRTILCPGHTNEYFTAYRAFSILNTEKDKSKILETLSTEQHITKKGLQLAGALLGACIS